MPRRHRPTRASTPVNPGAPPSSGGGGGANVIKVMLGCGCVAVLAGITITAIVLGGGFFVAKKTYDENKESIDEVSTTIKEAREFAEEERERTREARERGGDAAAEVTEEDVDALEIARWSDAPISEGELERQLGFMREWKNSETVTELRESRQTFQELSAKKGETDTVDKLRAINATRKYIQNVGPAQQELEQLAADHGGKQEVIERYIKTVVIAAAATAVARKHDIEDRASDRVVRQMRAERPAQKEAYEAWHRITTEQYRAASGAGAAELEQLLEDPDYQEKMREQGALLDKQQSSPGLLMLGKAPDASLEAWAALSVSQRRELLDTSTTLPFLSVFVLYAARGVEIDAFAGALLAVDLAAIQQRLADEASAEEAPK